MSAATTRGRLLDCAAIMAEFGVKRATAEAYMRKLPKVEVDGVRKSFVWRKDLEQLLEESTKAA